MCWSATSPLRAPNRWRRRTRGTSSVASRLGWATAALLVGEVIDVFGRRRDLHLKGSGRTSFARGGDGKAAVGPMLREYVMGEAMHALGIPTTRALAVVATGDPVRRRDGAARCGACSCGRESPARRHVPVRSCSSRHRNGAAGGRPRDRPSLPAPRRPARSVPGPVAGSGAGAGRAGRELDAGRLRPRSDEHRQHHHLRRDDRLRAVRLHGPVRPCDGVQLHRPRRSLRTATSRRSSSGTSPGSPSPCCR